MADDVYFLSDRDRTTLQEFVRRSQGALRGMQRQSSDPALQNDFQPPEVYVAEPPLGGIPANGHADCQIYRVDTQGNTGPPNLTGVLAVTKRVYNLSPANLPGLTPVFALRDKFGTWIAVNLAASLCPQSVTWNPLTGAHGIVDCNGDVIGSAPGCCGPCCPAMPATVCGTICTSTDPAFSVGAKIVLAESLVQPAVIDPRACSGTLDTTGTGTGTGSHAQEPCTPASKVVWVGTVPQAGGGAGQNEVQTITVTHDVSPPGNTYRLTFNGQTTTSLQTGAVGAAALIQAALQALSTVGAGNVAVTGPDGVPGGPFTVTFTGTLGNAPQPLIGWTASNVRLSVAEVVKGSTGNLAMLVLSDTACGAVFYQGAAGTVAALLALLGAGSGLPATALQSPAAIPTPCCAPFNSGIVNFATQGGSVGVELYACGSGGGGGGGNCQPSNLCFSVAGIAGWNGGTSPNGNFSLPFVATVSGVNYYGAYNSSGTYIGPGWGAFIDPRTMPQTVQITINGTASGGTCGSQNYQGNSAGCMFPTTLTFGGNMGGGCGTNWPAVVIVNAC